jgi:hypothetical protein
MVEILIVLMAYTNLTGYAGSPASNGYCAASCHGNGTFQLNVNGFPQTYTPGQFYTITVSAGSGTIKNFNLCILDGSNSSAGTLQPGSNTETYSHSGEGTGIHGSSPNQSSYDFVWIAPVQGTGTVTLYVAAHQGNKNGPNQNLTLTSQEGLSVEESFSPVKESPEYGIKIYSVTGKLISRKEFKNKKGIYFIKSGGKFRKVIKY